MASIRRENATISPLVSKGGDRTIVSPHPTIVDNVSLTPTFRNSTERRSTHSELTFIKWREAELISPDPYAVKNEGEKARLRAILLLDLQDLGRDLGKTPTTAEAAPYIDRGDIYSVHIYRKFFDSWKLALVYAGFILSAKGTSSPESNGEIPGSSFQDAGVIQQFTNLTKQVDRLPVWSDFERWHKDHSLPSPQEIVSTFGSLSQGRQVMGLAKFQKAEDHKKQEFVSDLLDLSKSLGHDPTVGEIKAAAAKGRTATYQTYFHVFKGYERLLAALREARGVELLRPRTESTQLELPGPDQVSEEAFAINSIKIVTSLLNRIPTYGDLAHAYAESMIACSPDQIIELFESIPKARVEAGVSSETPTSTQAYREELMLDMGDLFKRLRNTGGIQITVLQALQAAESRGELAPLKDFYKNEFGTLSTAVLATEFRWPVENKAVSEDRWMPSVQIASNFETRVGNQIAKMKDDDFLTNITLDELSNVARLIGPSGKRSDLVNSVARILAHRISHILEAQIVKNVVELERAIGAPSFMLLRKHLDVDTNAVMKKTAELILDEADKTLRNRNRATHLPGVIISDSLRAKLESW